MPRVLLTVGLAALVPLAGYCAFVGSEGSNRLVNPWDVSQDCTTPAQLGWAYEAINYDIADDLRLAAANPDMTSCASQGATAGNEVVATDGTRLAGWYIPAAIPPDPAAPTVLIVHGHSDNKSAMLPTAAALHDRYDVVIMDLRDTGRSSGAEHTLGALEQHDVAAMLDWLVETKRPQHIAVLGVSGGAAASLALARTDDRIEALIADSVHARIQTLVEQIAENEEQPAYPGTWAILLGIWFRTGEDLREVDPIDSLAVLGDRPLLLLHGTVDTNDVPADSAELLYAEAIGLGMDVTLRYCEGAGHTDVILVCPTEYGTWVSDFLTYAFGPS